MFFADPEAAFANIARALRPGGRLTFACCQELFANEWMFIPGAAAITVSGEMPPMPAPGEPGPFSLADPARIEALLTGAGFGAIEVAPANQEIVVGADWVDRAVTAMSGIGVVREVLAKRDDPLFHEQVHAAVRDAMSERVRDGALHLNA